MRRSVLIVLCLIVGAVLCLVVVGAILFLKDDPPPQINYTFRDLEVPAEVAASQPVLLRYLRGGTNSIEIALSDEILRLAGQSTNLLPHAEEIVSAWTLCTEGRSYIDELNQFPGITDWGNPDELPDMLNFDLPDYSMHQDLGRLYVLYAKLCAQQGNARQGIEVLSEHYAMIRNALPHMSLLINRVLFFAMARMDVNAAAQILQSADLSQEELKLIREVFSPLKDDELSLFRPILLEYEGGRSSVLMIRDNMSTELSDVPLAKRILYKPNRTLSIFKQIYEPMLEVSKRKNYSSGAFLRESKEREAYLEELYSHRDISNFVGIMLLEIGQPSFEVMYNIVSRAQEKSDLLALEIERRMGGTLELKDPFSGEAYLYDEERGAYFGVGEDGIPGTDDDVYAGDRL